MHLHNETTVQLDFEKDVINIPETLGTPAGMTIDEEGMLWIAHWGALVFTDGIRRTENC
jgi:sugar lactone lactonase YvrE